MSIIKVAGINWKAVGGYGAGGAAVGGILGALSTNDPEERKGRALKGALLGGGLGAVGAGFLAKQLPKSTEASSAATELIPNSEAWMNVKLPGTSAMPTNMRSKVMAHHMGINLGL